MSIELRVPSAGESITKVQIGAWRKREGEPVAKDEILVEIETDKATMELPSPQAGVLGKILKPEGEFAQVGDLIAYLEAAAQGAEGKEKQAEPSQEAARPAAQAAAPVSESAGSAARGAHAPSTPRPLGPSAPQPAHVMPAAQRVLAERGLRSEEVAPTGPGGRLLKEDVLRHPPAQGSEGPKGKGEGGELPPDAARLAASMPASAARAAVPSTPRPLSPSAPSMHAGDRHEEAVPMSPMRQRIAQRLVEAKQNAALLTTFNEIDMGAVLALRQEHQEAFTQKYGIKLGFMSFFVKAAVDALKLIPQINAEIRDLPGSDGAPLPHVVYRNHYDIGVAVGGGKGLVVPIIRNAERLSFAEIELTIADFGKRAKENKIALDELAGGTFTISNGGIYGSLLSTPIINPPQSGILGLHAMQDRPVARNGQVVIRPMMYVALTYDHRIVDGREAVTFLKRIKDAVEQPARMLLEV